MKRIVLPILLFILFPVLVSAQDPTVESTSSVINPFGAQLRPLEGHRKDKLNSFATIQTLEENLLQFEGSELTEEEAESKFNIQKMLVLTKISALDSYSKQILEGLNEVTLFTPVEKNLVTTTITRLSTALESYRDLANEADNVEDLKAVVSSLSAEGNNVFTVFRSTSLVIQIYQATEIIEQINSYILLLETQISKVAESGNDVSNIVSKLEFARSSLKSASETLNISRNIVVEDPNDFVLIREGLSKAIGLSRGAKNDLIIVVKDLNVLYKQTPWSLK